MNNNDGKEIISMYYKRRDVYFERMLDRIACFETIEQSLSKMPKKKVFGYLKP